VLPRSAFATVGAPEAAGEIGAFLVERIDPDPGRFPRILQAPFGLPDHRAACSAAAESGRSLRGRRARSHLIVRRNDGAGEIRCGSGAILLALSRTVRSALLLAAALLPLAVQAGAVIDLLDASREAHPATLVELLVHGHTHGRKVVSHAHAAPGDRDRGPRLGAPDQVATLPTTAGAMTAVASSTRYPHEPAAVGSSLPPKFLLHASLLR